MRRNRLSCDYIGQVAIEAIKPIESFSCGEHAVNELLMQVLGVIAN